jgi:hypothetical protein
MCMDNRNEQSNKWGNKAHLRIIAPLPSGANNGKTKSATGNIYAPTSRTIGAPRPRAQRSYSIAWHIYYTYSGYVLSIYSKTYRAGHGGPRRTKARHGGQTDTHASVYYVTKCRKLIPCHSLRLLVYGKGGEEEDGG